MSTIHSWLNQALEFHRCGNTDAAERLYRKALAAAPREPRLLYLLGLLCLDAGRVEEAIVLLGKAVGGQPNFPDAHFQLGNAYTDARRLEDAVNAFQRAASCRKDFFEAHYNLGNTLRALHRPTAAVDAYRKAADLRPDFAETFLGLGVVLHGEGKHEEAIKNLQIAVERDPRCSEAWFQLGLSFQALDRPADADNAYRAALAVVPNHARALNNRGVALKEMGLLEEAERSLRTVLAQSPQYAEAQNNLGITLQARGRVMEAENCFLQAIHLDANFTDAHFNLGIVCALSGRLAEAWPEMEWRTRVKVLGLSECSGPGWDGRHQPDKTLLLRTEQGIGDTIQFARYVALARARVGRVLLQCPTHLMDLLRDLEGVDEMLPLYAPVPAFDMQASLMSLPAIFDTRPETIPAAVPYLFAGRARSDCWRGRIQRRTGLKVGIVWSGNPLHKNDKNRSCALNDFLSLCDVPGLQLFSLQKGTGAEQCAYAFKTHGIEDLSEDLDDLTETAAVLQNMDLLISVDTSVAHLAGALGRPVWTLLPFAPDWRWMLGRNDTPWYPTMRLFRQSIRSDWSAVFQEVIRELTAMTAQSRLAA